MLLLISFPNMEAIIKSIEDLQIKVHEAQQLMNSGYIKLVDAHNAQIKGLEDVGDSGSPCADRWCTDSCSLEAKYTERQYLTWFGKLPTSTGEVNIIRDR